MIMDVPRDSRSRLGEGSPLTGGLENRLAVGSFSEAWTEGQALSFGRWTLTSSRDDKSDAGQCQEGRAGLGSSNLEGGLVEEEAGASLSDVPDAAYAKKLMPSTRSRLESTLPRRDCWTRLSWFCRSAAMATMSSTALPKLRPVSALHGKRSRRVQEAAEGLAHLHGQLLCGITKQLEVRLQDSGWAYLCKGNDGNEGQGEAGCCAPFCVIGDKREGDCDEEEVEPRAKEEVFGRLDGVERVGGACLLLSQERG